MSLPVCPECGGSGHYDPTNTTDFKMYGKACPACGGSGVDAKAVEAVGRYMNPGPWWDDPEHYKASIALYRERAVDTIEVVSEVLAVLDKEG